MAECIVKVQPGFQDGADTMITVALAKGGLLGTVFGSQRLD